MVIWFIGLSGSGKSTLGREVARQWQAIESNTVLLDGDELRAVFAQDKGDEPYSVTGRRRNAERLTALCELLDRQGINVVCCILSIFPDMRAENRQRFSRYFEVFMDAPLPILQARDVKGLYGAALAGREKNVVGIDIPFERPSSADMVIDSSGTLQDLEQLAATVLVRARST
jgi:cytidine diphosphoramidate kinase